MARDLVCGMMVDEKKTKYVFEYKSRRYYFCSEACMNIFKNNPEKYVK
ncbi:MAG: YHS domain-containing protein [Aigarchaeota archaeon]|nr:YHS domain-containing protein [Aigarchaeota archaeon]MCX8192732.1 YHS domain-containing protein [Nitrososphaeria archaeon]